VLQELEDDLKTLWQHDLSLSLLVSVSLSAPLSVSVAHRDNLCGMRSRGGVVGPGENREQAVVRRKSRLIFCVIVYQSADRGEMIR
jgi:hypothetical protein